MTKYTDAFEHAGLTVGIWSEEYIESFMSPRDIEDGLLGVMFCEYPRYTLGDKDAPDPRDQTATCEKCGGSGSMPNILGDGYRSTIDPDKDCPACEGDGEIEVGIVEYLVREHGATVVLPLFVYEHSGITMSCGKNLVTGSDDFRRTGRFVPGDGWDTSSVGVIFDTDESRKRCGWEERSVEEIERDLTEEVRYYAAYLEGMVFGFDVIAAREDEGELIDVQTGEPIDSLDEAETLDSMGGMLDPDAWSAEKSYVQREAREAAEYAAEQVANEKIEAHRWACADVVTVA